VAPDVIDAIRAVLDASWAARRAAHDALAAIDARPDAVDVHLARAAIIAARADLESAHDALRYCARALRAAERRR
jgi:hypothetical protein